MKNENIKFFVYFGSLWKKTGLKDEICFIFYLFQTLKLVKFDLYRM